MYGSLTIRWLVCGAIATVFAVLAAVGWHHREAEAESSTAAIPQNGFWRPTPAAIPNDGKLRIIAFGAHPDDCELKAAGVGAKWAALGHQVKFVSVTNGDIGHWGMAGGPLANRRRAEVREAARILGITTEVLDIHDGELLPSLENRRTLTRLIREWKADIVLSHRPNDYHPDHRNVGLLVQDAAFMVTVPHFCPDVPYLEKNPLFLYYEDRFTKPTRFHADVIVGIDDVIAKKLAVTEALESQFYEGGALGGPRLVPDPVNLPAVAARKKEVREQFETRFAATAQRFGLPLAEWYGAEKAKQVKYAEAFEICEYGRMPTHEELRKLFPFFPTVAEQPKSSAIVPTEKIALFNGKNLDGLSTWLRKTKMEDPRKVFSVEDGVIHVSGEDFGYAATDTEYRDYHVSVEFKWGKKTDGGKYVRNSGLLLNAVGPHGGASGTWMSCIELQLAQGCVGDLILIRGKNDKEQPIPVSLTSDIVLGPDKRPRWQEGGLKTVLTNRQLWWNNHDPDFQEFLDTRGKNDVDSPLGEWTKVEAICAGNTITVIVNGKTVNKAYDVSPAAGKILLQSEGFEVFFRNFEIGPVKK